MSDQKDTTDFETVVFEEEENQDMRSEEVTNAYFLLDLNIPSPKKDGGTVVRKSNHNEPSSSTKLHKFGFLELLEKIHGKDLRTNNPWLNPKASRVHWKAKTKKQVRFSTTEINSKQAELPWCRKKGDPSMKPGQLHAPNCRNATQETVEVLGDHVWQNRVFILDSYVRNALHSYSRSRDNSESEEEEEGYYRGTAESLEEIGVFDSVELAKQRMCMSGRDNIQGSDAEYPSTSTDEQEKCRTLPLLHPDTANLNLELGSPISDEECPTTASTLKHLSDHAFTDSPDSVFVWPHHSADSNQSSQTDSQTANQTASQTASQTTSQTELATSSDLGLDAAFRSTENQFKFQMFEPPKFQKLLSHSDYGSEEADENSDDDSDLTKLLEELPKISPIKPSPETTGAKHSKKITVRVEPPTPSSRPPEIRNSFIKPAESARLRGTVKVNEKSVIGSMMCPQTSSTTQPRNDTKIKQLTEFMFDTPSPHD